MLRTTTWQNSIWKGKKKKIWHQKHNSKVRKVRFDSEEIKSGTENKMGNVRMSDLFKVTETTHEKNFSYTCS